MLSQQLKHEDRKRETKNVCVCWWVSLQSSRDIHVACMACLVCVEGEMWLFPRFTSVSQFTEVFRSAGRWPSGSVALGDRLEREVKVDLHRHLCPLPPTMQARTHVHKHEHTHTNTENICRCMQTTHTHISVHAQLTIIVRKYKHF